MQTHLIELPPKTGSSFMANRLGLQLTRHKGPLIDPFSMNDRNMPGDILYIDTHNDATELNQRFELINQEIKTDVSKLCVVPLPGCE